jgi:hypothetical protein
MCHKHLSETTVPVVGDTDHFFHFSLLIPVEMALSIKKAHIKYLLFVKTVGHPLPQEMCIVSGLA